MRRIIKTITVTRVVATIKNITTDDVRNVDFLIFGEFNVAKAWRTAKRYVTNDNERVVDVQLGDTDTARYAMDIENFIVNADIVTRVEPEAE